ncbi:cell division protein FtsL [Brevibacillus ginsengisoli]|uniref:cell division protein FtsL n=1 Tax=Brevibacillus ginsengisoli TaxID=363854 RepID=UPI003CEF6821
MSYYYRGNLAVELESKSKSKTTTRKKRTVVIKSAIPVQEKLLYILLVCLIVSAAGFVGYRYVQISELNYQIQATKIEIKDIQEKNAALQLKVDSMSSHDEVARGAQEMGMTFSPGAVRVISLDGSQSKKTVVQANN